MAALRHELGAARPITNSMTHGVNLGLAGAVLIQNHASPEKSAGAMARNANRASFPHVPVNTAWQDELNDIAIKQEGDSTDRIM